MLVEGVQFGLPPKDQPQNLASFLVSAAADILCAGEEEATVSQKADVLFLTSAGLHSTSEFFFRPIFFQHERSEKDAAIHVAMMAGGAAAQVARRSQALLFFKKNSKIVRIC